MDGATILPIAIVGGGIGGLATALALSKKGYPVQVLEQASEFKEIGAGIQLGPNAFRVFSILGVTDEIQRLAVAPAGLMLRDCITGEEVTCVPLGAQFEEHFGFPYAVIHRADLHSVLLGGCKRSPLIELKTSQSVCGIDEIGERVRVTTADGQRYDAAAVIGADGLWSTVREMFVN